MHNAMVMGTFIIGFLLLCVHLSGTLGRAVLPNLAVGDLIMPTLTVELLPPFWAGVFVAGPLAAIMSTVDTMLLLVSAAIIKDLYVRYRLKGDTAQIPANKLSRMSLLCTFGTGILVFLASFNPPDLLVWINLFAFGGLEAVFLWPVVLGLYWRKANACGALWSMAGGVVTFIVLTASKIPLMGIHPIVPTVLISLLAFWLGGYYGSPVSKEVERLFWGDVRS